MDVFQPSSPQSAARKDASTLDPRLRPTPDYGTLDSGSALEQTSRKPELCPRSSSRLRLLHLAAMIAGIGAAFAVSSAGGVGAVWSRFGGPPSLQKQPIGSTEIISDKDLDRQKPQRQAEILLERAVARTGTSPAQVAAQIESRVDGWRGRIKWDAQLGDLTTAALNSSDRDLQNSAIEVQIAAYGLAKNESSVDALARQADSSDHAQKIWALWALGLLANRGIETDRVTQILIAHLKDSDRGSDRDAEDARRWAAEGLALVGTTATIEPLLDALHNDPSATVRERAACSLAESGMLSHEQRMIAVPQLINYSGDQTLDAQTRGWAFQALGDITKQRLPNDAAAWRQWYQNSGAGN